MIPHQTKTGKLPGTSYSEVRKQALSVFDKIKKSTKRNPYIRSAYFEREKVFFDYFWQHLLQKSHKERVRRLKYFACAIEVIRNSRNKPHIEVNRNRPSEILYRFGGLTKDKELFYVQIKEDRSQKKYFMSCFPIE